MRAGRAGWMLGLLLVALILVAVWLIPKYVAKEHTLHGVLVDLEFCGPDLSRYAELTDAFERRLPAEVTALSNLRITLEYVHFSKLESTFFDARHVDFVILSPQGTPWCRYDREVAAQMIAMKGLLRELVLSRSMPVLGICGGHQFLAMAFGGSVDFIDTRFVGSTPDAYPQEALAERGPVYVETLADDPIFEGVVRHPGKFLVMESHREEVKGVPLTFVNLAKSSVSAIQVIRMRGKVVYGMAFHPERGWNATNDALAQSNAGKQMLANFLRMVSQGT